MNKVNTVKAHHKHDDESHQIGVLEDETQKNLPIAGLASLLS